MTAIPREIRLSGQRTRLDVFWEDGTASRLAAATLRARSRSAGAVRAEIDALPLALPADLSIAEVNPVGAYALNLVFSDGEHRGIYPWTYLRALGEHAAAQA